MLHNLDKEQKKAFMSQIIAILKAYKKQGYPSLDEEDCKKKFAKELQLTEEEIDSQFKAIEKYLAYLNELDAEDNLEKVWSEFAKALDSGDNSIKKIVYFEICTFIATLDRFRQKDDEDKDNKINPEYKDANIKQQAGLAAEVLETAKENAEANYCEFLRKKLGISHDIARRLEDIASYELDVCEHINYAVELD